MRGLGRAEPKRKPKPKKKSETRVIKADLCSDGKYTPGRPTPLPGDKPMAVRANGGKAPLSYMLQFGPALEGVARNCAFGAHKYSRFGNYDQPFYVSELVDSNMRHLKSFFVRDDADDFVPDARAAGFNVHHIDAAIWNLLQLRTQIANPDFDEYDDRPPPRDE